MRQRMVLIFNKDINYMQKLGFMVKDSFIHNNIEGQIKMFFNSEELLKFYANNKIDIIFINICYCQDTVITADYQQIMGILEKVCENRLFT